MKDIWQFELLGLVFLIGLNNLGFFFVCGVNNDLIEANKLFLFVLHLVGQFYTTKRWFTNFSRCFAA